MTVLSAVHRIARCGVRNLRPSCDYHRSGGFGFVYGCDTCFCVQSYLCVATDNGDVIRCDTTSLAAANSADDYDENSQRQSKSYVISRHKVVLLVTFTPSPALPNFYLTAVFHSALRNTGIT